jgi:cell wall-associated NlpC family hydrolase
VFKAWENAGRIVPPTTHCYPNSKLVRECRSDEPLQPGDILWRQGHVGIYVGEGMVVHASGKKYGVKKDPLAQFKYTKRYRPHGV